MTLTIPYRRITLHFSQIFLTLGRTFNSYPSCLLSLLLCHYRSVTTALSLPSRCRRTSGAALHEHLLVSIRNSPSGQVIRRELDLDLVPRQNPDVVHPHLARDVSQDLVPIFQFDPEHRVGQRFHNRSLNENGVIFGLGQKDYLPVGREQPR